MPHVDQVVDLRTATDAGFIERTAIDGRIGSNLDVILNHQTSDLRKFLVVPGLAVAHVTESVAAQYRARVHDHAVTERRSGIQGNVGINLAVAANPYSGTDRAACTDPRVLADLRPFAADTHDFESRYLDGLIGPLPEADSVYTERAPVGHVTGLTCPILLLQGLDDPIVPPSQSEAIAADLAAHGIRHAYIAFPGESHGFRKAETVTASLEAELAFYGEIFGFNPPGVPPIELS